MLQEREENLIKSILEKAIDNKELAGANILLLKEGNEIFYHQNGYADINSKKLIQRDTIFRLYSMTKPITAVCIMILLERGEIDLYEPVSTFLPGFKNQKVLENGKLVTPKREMVIKDLLNMTSGLLYPGLDSAGKTVDSLFKDLDKKLFTPNALKTLEVANALGETYLSFHPGESWAYGTSADVLGGIIEVVSGKTLGEFMDKELFSPLEMKDTGFYLPTNKIFRLATVYDCSNNNFEIYNGNNLGVTNSMESKPAFESGGAGLVGTIDDYASFANMLINHGRHNGKTIMQPSTVKFLTTQILTESQSDNFKTWFTLSGYSYGNLMRIMTNPELCGGLSSSGEYGWDGWLGCYMANIPNEKLSILVMMQKKDGGTISFTRKLRNIILGSIGRNS